MTVYGLVASLVWAAVVFDAVRRAERLAYRAVPRDAMRPTSEPAPPLVPPVRSNIVVPDDLVAVALMESEAWAVDDQLALLREKYLEYGDWQKVRRAMGVGEMPA